MSSASRSPWPAVSRRPTKCRAEPSLGSPAAATQGISGRPVRCFRRSNKLSLVRHFPLAQSGFADRGLRIPTSLHLAGGDGGSGWPPRVRAVTKKRVACVFARDQDAILSGILRGSAWEVEAVDVAAPFSKSSLPKDCSIGILLLTTKEPVWLGKLLSTVAQLRDMNWIAVVDRALIDDRQVRECIAVHCVDYQTTPLERDRVLF